MTTHRFASGSRRVPEPPSQTSKPPRVLVVEADHRLRERIATALVRMGCLPIEAACAEEAWAWAISDQLDLALVSQGLPQMTGAELVTRIRASRDGLARDLPVIGLAREEVCERHLAGAGVSCFVRSPYDEADLARAVRWVDEVYWSDASDEVSEEAR